MKAAWKYKDAIKANQLLLVPPEIERVCHGKRAASLLVHGPDNPPWIELFHLGKP